jgi:hypothetical protein
MQNEIPLGGIAIDQTRYFGEQGNYSRREHTG